MEGGHNLGTAIADVGRDGLDLLPVQASSGDDVRPCLNADTVVTHAGGPSDILRLVGGGGGSSSDEEDRLLATVKTDPWRDTELHSEWSESEDDDALYKAAALLAGNVTSLSSEEGRNAGSAAPPGRTGVPGAEAPRQEVGISPSPPEDLEGEEVLRERDEDSEDEQRVFEDLRGEEAELLASLQDKFTRSHGWAWRAGMEEFLEHFDRRG